MKHILKQFVRREAHPVIQFIKYAISGGIATVVDIVLFFFLAWKVIPALGVNDPFVRLLRVSVEVIDELTRSRHYLINKVITFFFGNLTAYILNVLWVFKPGRHARWKEFSLFFLVSITSWVIGTLLGWFLIRVFGWTTTLVYIINMITSLMINYVCRKFLVFHG